MKRILAAAFLVTTAAFAAENDATPPKAALDAITPEDYLKHIANKHLRLYKGPDYLHTEGDKQGQSLYSHVMDLVSFTDRLAPVIGLSDEEMRCVLLALTVHDINKIPLYMSGI